MISAAEPNGHTHDFRGVLRQREQCQTIMVELADLLNGIGLSKPQPLDGMQQQQNEAIMRVLNEPNWHGTFSKRGRAKKSAFLVDTAALMFPMKGAPAYLTPNVP